ncbi:hypothetical protein V9K67_16585 [Paraflavisolibacter sp. H34]|uniref:hypothetical protein n=1 Tax=Huijunlia imazamoxiresistens TaxID=3127457 RepID=UPI00301B0932
MTEKKLARFVGGPLDGQTLEVDHGQTQFVFEEHPDIEDITQAELPPGYFPSSFEVTYEEAPAGSGTFVLKE